MKYIKKCRYCWKEINVLSPIVFCSEECRVSHRRELAKKYMKRYYVENRDEILKKQMERDKRKKYKNKLLHKITKDG